MQTLCGFCWRKGLRTRLAARKVRELYGMKRDTQRRRRRKRETGAQKMRWLRMKEKDNETATVCIEDETVERRANGYQECLPSAKCNVAKTEEWTWQRNEKKHSDCSRGLLESFRRQKKSLEHWNFLHGVSCTRKTMHTRTRRKRAVSLHHFSSSLCGSMTMHFFTMVFLCSFKYLSVHLEPLKKTVVVSATVPVSEGYYCRFCRKLTVSSLYTVTSDLVFRHHHNWLMEYISATIPIFPVAFSMQSVFVSFTFPTLYFFRNVFPMSISFSFFCTCFSLHPVQHQHFPLTHSLSKRFSSHPKPRQPSAWAPFDPKFSGFIPSSTKPLLRSFSSDCQNNFCKRKSRVGIFT